MGRLVHVGPRVAVGEVVGHRREVALGRVGDLRELLPRHRRAHRCTRAGAQAPRTGDGAVPVVLVEVDEDPLAALLLPPGRRHPVVTPLELATEADRRVPQFPEGPARLDAHVDVDAAVAARLRVAPHAEVLEELARDSGDALRVGEARARLRVEVDAQLVGVVDVRSAHRPRVEGQRAHLRRPDQGRRLGRAQLLGTAPAREGDAHGLDPVGCAPGQPLLVEAVGVLVTRADRQPHPLAPAVGPALHRRGPLADLPHHRLADRGVVLAHLQFGDHRGALGRLVDDPVGAGDADLAVTGGHHHGGGLGHAVSVWAATDEGGRLGSLRPVG